jgi:hypothetical protein
VFINIQLGLLLWTVLLYIRLCRFIYCVQTYIPSDVCPGSVYEDHIVVAVFWRTSTLISTVSSLIYISNKSIWGLLSSCIFTSICCCFLDNSHSGWDEMKSLCHFDLFPLWLRVLSIPLCILALSLSIYISSLENCLLNPFAHLSIGLFIFVLIFRLYTYWILIIYLMNSWKRFSPILYAFSLIW